LKLGSRGYWIAVLVLIGISFGVGQLQRSLGGQSVEFVDPPDAQTRDIRYVELQLDTEPWYPFENQYGPVSFQRGAAGTHFIVRSVPEGDRIEALHEIEGEVVADGLPALPPELEFIFGTAVDDARLWLADFSGQHLHFFDLDARSWGTLETPQPAYRVAASHESGSVFVMHVPSESLFTRIDFEGGSTLAVHPFGDLLTDQFETSLALDGWIVHSGEKLIYAGKHLASLAAFANDGTLSYLRETVAPPPRPTIAVREGDRSLRHDIYPASIALAADALDIFLLTYRRVGIEDRYVLDVYRGDDGEYRGSFLLPTGDKWSSVALVENFVVVAGRSGVYRLARTSFEIDDSRQETSNAKT
jgi:hypothetical protein